MDKERIIEVLGSWNFWNRDMDVGILRGSYLNDMLRFVKTDKIVSIVGVRRSGKSTLIRQMAKTLMDEGVNKNDILIVNFEEPEFGGADVAFLQRVYDAYLEIVKPSKKPFIFLDEIQNVKGWERFVRSLNERKDVFVTISGSSSKLLSHELASVLTGRQIYIEVLPLSFREFLNFEGVVIKETRDILLNSLRIRTSLRGYMESGGFPEIVLSDDPDFRLRALRSYYEDIIGRDIVQRFNVKKSDKLKALARFYLTNPSSLISFNKISKSNFIELPTETVRRFSSYLEVSNMLFFVRRFSWSVKEQENSPRKVYSIDVGLSNIAGFRFSKNTGKIAENLVAIALRGKRMRNPDLEVFYWRGNAGKEVDFVIKDALKVKEVIQVCRDIKDINTRKREVDALLKAMDEFKLERGLVVTEDYEGEEKRKDKTITFVPLWKWLLEG